MAFGVYRGDGSSCRGDGDEDGVVDACDVCPDDYDPTQDDADGDGVGDFCDNCAATPNPGQNDHDSDGIGDACVVVAQLDIMPGVCTNQLNKRARQTLSMALVGSKSFDVSEVDPESIVLTRAGDHREMIPPSLPASFGLTRATDVASSHDGDVCECPPSGPDGRKDLVLEFDTSKVIRGLGLSSKQPGTSVRLTMKGFLFDGTAFEASDCLIAPATALDTHRGKRRSR
jgi:hypothetical protein